MNFFSKSSILFAVLGLALPLTPALAETSSGSSSTVSTQNPKTSAKSDDQPHAKTSPATQSDGVKGSTTAHLAEPSASGKEVSTAPDPVAAPQGPALFKLIDTDKDGRISLTEFTAYGAAPAARTPGAVKTSPGGNVPSNSPSGSTSSNASTKSDASKTDHSDHQPAAIPEPVSPGAGILTSTDTRVGKYTAEVFEILDINHDKYLSQAELDALIPAHQISQP